MKGCDQAITRDPYNFDFIELTVDHIVDFMKHQTRFKKARSR